ncbi:MAG: sigma 54-interacting transcriptional regulator [Pseudomonadota bacterium]
MTKPINKDELLDYVSRALKVSRASRRDDDWRAEIITRSPLINERLHQAEVIAGNSTRVLLRGPSGAGKGLFALAMHRVSKERHGPFLSVGCSAIDEESLAAELFGHGTTPGHFQNASGGILLLNEIGDLPMSLQVRLLRVFEEKAVHPLGGNDAVPVDVRVFATTNQDLPARLIDGEFRDDLYYRLIEATLDVPALSEHREDIPVLANHFLRKAMQEMGRDKMVYAPEAIELMMGAPWPGNVRELANTVKRHVSVCQAPVISAAVVQDCLGQQSEQLMSFAEARDEFIRSYLVQLLTMTRGNVSKAARMAKRNRTDFYKLLARHDLDPDVFKHARQ